MTVISCKPQEQKQALASFVECIVFSEPGHVEVVDFAEKCLDFCIIKGCVNCPSFVNYQGIWLIFESFQTMFAV